MSWESTVPYYREINQCVQARLGGHWDAAGRLLGNVARTLEAAGAAEWSLQQNTRPD